MKQKRGSFRFPVAGKSQRVSEILRTDHHGLGDVLFLLLSEAVPDVGLGVVAQACQAIKAKGQNDGNRDERPAATVLIVFTCETARVVVIRAAREQGGRQALEPLEQMNDNNTQHRDMTSNVNKTECLRCSAAPNTKAENEESPSMTGFLFMILVRRAVCS
ncbi:hypothetical protein KPSA1_04268 [Pseudomonas syringae pv. actinidiae]|uniref:Uncharacterized protein n=1 Tax=Pseudomonas syringae pv. actinidiae TaxID=103796 RepID=A0A2V0QNP6_PSESF|nr:hypothetical protein KPSA1_04268 [Pseudomonas syringae pv. actinidiae]